MTLTQLLSQFKSKNQAIQIRPRVIELTECFRNTSGRLNGPIQFGNLEENVVLGYVVIGADYARKYELDLKTNKVRWENDKPVIREFDATLRALSCLCLPAIANTSFHEIYDALISGEDKIQRFHAWQWKNVEREFVRAYSDFDARYDTGFVFSGQRGHGYNAIQLNSLWLSQMVQRGGKMLDDMSPHEVRLMKHLFPKAALQGDKQAILENSYMYGRELYTPESTEFLTRKVSAFQRQ